MKSETAASRSSCRTGGSLPGQFERTSGNGEAAGLICLGACGGLSL